MADNINPTTKSTRREPPKAKTATAKPSSIESNAAKTVDVRCIQLFHGDDRIHRRRHHPFGPMQTFYKRSVTRSMKSKGRHHNLLVDPEYRHLGVPRFLVRTCTRKYSRSPGSSGMEKVDGEVYWEAAYSRVIDDEGTTVKVVKLAADVTVDAMREIRAQEREAEVQAQQSTDKRLLEEKVNESFNQRRGSIKGRSDAYKSPSSGSDDMGRLGTSLQKMICDLRTIIGEVMAAAQQQNEGARTIAESRQTSAKVPQTQASVEEMTASVAQMISKRWQVTSKERQHRQIQSG